jgi:hypothetical protein
MTNKIDTLETRSYSIGQKWLNTENGWEFYITDITDTIVSLDDMKKKLSSFEHMNKYLWNHLVSLGVYKRLL